MWIIPKNSPIYRCAQDTAALTSDFSALSEQYAQSVMWRSDFSQSATWLLRSKQVSWITALFSQTLSSSLGKSLVGEWTSSVEASLASHLAQPGSEQEIKTLDISGPTSQTESGDWDDLPLFSSRTLKESSAQSSQAHIGLTPKERLFCSTSIARWNDWVTTQRQVFLARAKLARRTNVSASLFLVSEQTCEQKVVQALTLCLLSEPEQINSSWTAVSVCGQLGPQPEEQSSTLGSRQECLDLSNWPTPTARDWKGVTNYQNQLPDFVKKWTKPMIRSGSLSKKMSMQTSGQMTPWLTPTVFDAQLSYLSLASILLRNRNNRQESTRCQHVLMVPTDATRALNPRWVEALMGLPIGWVMPSCTSPVTIEQMSCDFSAMELCPTQPPLPSESCGSASETSEMWLTPTTMEAKRAPYSSIAKLDALEKQHQPSLMAQVQRR